MRLDSRLIATGLLAALGGPAMAGEADVLEVRVRAQSAEAYGFEVTVRHADEGWDHYADAWEVLGPDGEVLGVRVLYHPHVGEQPFTRSLRDVRIPAGIRKVRLRAHDSVHGNGGKEVEVELPLR